MVRLTIDEKTIETEEGKTILEAAGENGIYIPTLCWHANLLSIGACRICLVEAEGYSNPMVSCATAAQEGMVVKTKSDKLSAMRRDYLKLLLAYHPLDCPVCDAGGECELQDLVFEHSIEKADYSAARQERVETYATPMIKYFENRCVLCLRCIHACREVSGRSVLDLVGAGIDARMAPTNAKSCISCGECLFVCPVGALTENLSPLKARLWQVARHSTTCPHCGFGCTFGIDVAADGYVTDVVQDVKNMPNRGSLCVLGRFGYDFANHEARIKKATVRLEGGHPSRLEGGHTSERQEARGVSPQPLSSPQEAASVAAERLAALDRQDKTIGFVVSPRATNEEIFLLKEIAGRLRHALLASSAFYHTGRVLDAYRRRGLSYPYDYDRLLDADLIIIAGANLLSNNHVFGDRVRDAYKLRGSRIMVIDPSPTALADIADAHVKPLPGSDSAFFDALSSFAASGADTACKACGIGADDFARALRLVSRAANIAVIFGSGISASEESLRALLDFCARRGIDKKGLIMPVAREANAVGAASILGNLSAPHELLANADVRGVFFYEEDPFHYMGEETAAAALQGKEFILVADALPSAVMRLADLAVPTGVFTEKEGAFFAGDGLIRRLSKAVDCGQPAYPGFAFLSALLQKLGGGAYRAPHDAAAGMREKGLILPAGVTVAASNQGNPGAPPAFGHILILRDIFSNHHLAGSEVYSKGIATVYRQPGSPVSEDRLFMSGTDAAAMGLAEGDVAHVASKSGAVDKPVSIKEGLRPGVLEYLVFRDRPEALRLMGTPAKWVEVKVLKG
jgi:NADH dehydrogenase/NADH:ubiquinone oxidoreductase subunit G